MPREYQVIRGDRVLGGGGGVTLLLQQHWSFEEVKLAEGADQREYTLRKATVRGVEIVVIYNPSPKIQFI